MCVCLCVCVCVRTCKQEHPLCACVTVCVLHMCVNVAAVDIMQTLKH